MDLFSFRVLLTPPGQAALQAAAGLEPRESDFLRHFSALNRSYPSDLARAALETAILRREAAVKFPFAERLYFTRPALEQASSYAVSAYRSRRFALYTCLLDLGCSIGADTQALARQAFTAGVDSDPLRLAMAVANLRALDLQDRSAFIQADLKNPLPVGPGARTAVFFDPARRSQGRRFFSVRDYQPPLSVAHTWLERFPAMGIKISPGVSLEEVRDYDAEVEFISLEGELKEAVLWLGELRTASRRATVLPGEHTLESPPGQLTPSTQHSLDEPRAFLYEPDPSILRAGLVQLLGEMLGAAQLDPDIAYLTAHTYQPTPFARAWAVEAWFPFSLKRLRAALRERHVGLITVKKRGSPLQPEALIRDLRLHGDQERVVFLTHLRGQPIAILSTGRAGGQMEEAI